MTKGMEWHGTADALRIGSIRRSEATRSVLLRLMGKLRRLTYAAAEGRSASSISKARGTAVMAK